METGIMPQTKANPQYGAVSEVDFQEMQNTLATAKTLFEELPEQVKALKNERLAQALKTQAGEETTSLPAGKSDESDAAKTVLT